MYYVFNKSANEELKPVIFNSVEFIIFFPLVVFAYYILPKKVRYVWLLAASYFFYMNWEPLYVLLLFSCTLVTYAAGLILERLKENNQKKKLCITVSLIICLGILGFFKYCDFAVENINRVLDILHLGQITWEHNIVLPVGISFYTLQALGYLIDVYRGDIYAEKNFLRYALFISFFPQLVAGPIERSKNLLVQLYTPKKFDYENFRRGFVLMLWGFFLKIVIADRAAIIVNTVYENPGEYRGFLVIAATFFFAIQIYCDFYGYSVIARGAARFLGIELMDNFNAPYFSQSVREFWRRWHISLSGWFRDYLYIPLGGNRKGTLRKQINLLTVFAVSGLWHGASAAFVFWGLLNGIYQIFADCFRYIRGGVKKFLGMTGETEDCFSIRVLRRVITFGLICFAWIFFRAGVMSDALDMINNMMQFNWVAMFDGSIYELGVSREYFKVLNLAILTLLYVDYHKYKGADMVNTLLKQKWWFRFLAELGLLFAIMMFGCYGTEYDTSEFIYFQF